MQLPSTACSNKTKREKKVSLQHLDALQAKLAFTESILITYWSIRIIHKKFTNLSINLIVVHGNRWFIGKFLKRNENHFLIIFMIVSCMYYFSRVLISSKLCRNAWLKTWFIAWTVLIKNSLSVATTFWFNIAWGYTYRLTLNS